MVHKFGIVNVKTLRYNYNPLPYYSTEYANHIIKLSETNLNKSDSMVQYTIQAIQKYIKVTKLWPMVCCPLAEFKTLYNITKNIWTPTEYKLHVNIQLFDV